MISIQLQGEQRLIARLTALPEQVRISLGRVITKLAIEVERNIKLKLSGSVLNVRTGVLRASIHHQVLMSATSVTATIGTGVNYARIHEFGVPHSWEIPKLKSARVLAFEVGGESVFTRRVTHPALPERSFERSTLAEMAPYIRAEIDAAVKQTVATGQ
jgi:phage gpG-like protein